MEGMHTFFYTDATGDRGSSEIMPDERAEGIRFDYVLREGFDYPYAGFSIIPDSGYLDLCAYRYLDVVISADTVCAVNIYLKTYEDSITREGDYITYRFCEKNLRIDQTARSYRIDLTKMTTPQWWLSVHGLEELGPPDLSRVIYFDVATCIRLLDRKGTVHLHSLTFRRDMRGWYGALFALIAPLSLAGLRLRRKSRLLKRSDPNPISYEKLQTQSSCPDDEQRIAACIGRRYCEAKLTLEDVSKECGVHWSRVSSILKKRHDLSFKQYLNTIKIEEAKRLLRQTDRKILDIALSVGYGDVSHFNRTFKQYVGCSPREYRKGA